LFTDALPTMIGRHVGMRDLSTGRLAAPCRGGRFMLSFWLWGGFVLFILTMLAIDLGVLNRHPHVIRTKEALVWTCVCIVLALLFNVAVYFIYENHWLGPPAEGVEHIRGKDAALDFFTGWLIEQSLSLDNIFVIALIFQYFRVPLVYQHRTLFWGILGALVMRGAMIGAGAALIKRFDWIVYVFGGLLLLTAVKMLRSQHENVEPDRNPLVRLARKLYPVTRDFHEQKFFVRIDGRRAVTPLFLVLLVIESTDLLFAVDSIPAIFAITKEPFIVFTSNVFAILNLRSLYFVLASAIDKFKYLKPCLVFVLAYVGVKMMLSHHYPIPTPVSLAIILGTLFVGIVASVMSERRAART
jgi:tellurite resistance protein TerC